MKESLVASNIEMFELIEELLKEGKVVRLKIKGTSMLPFLQDGTTQVEISAPEEEEIKAGALVLFRYKGEFILHRILHRKGNRLVLRGDNLYQSKEFIATEQVIGMVRKIILPEYRTINTQSLYWKVLSHSWLLIKPIVKIAGRIKFRLSGIFSR